MRHTTPELRQARQLLIERGAAPPGMIADRLARSWQRSMDAGLLPQGRLPSMEHASDQDLRHTLARNHALLAHSRPIMEYLYEQVRHAQNVVILSDGRGTLMDTIGDPLFLDKAQRVALATGASWREEHRGTNAIGTAIAEEAAVEIHGAEHFLERNGFLTCAAAPILSACGHVIGVLDISGDQHHCHPLTLGLVSTAARMIENRLLIAGSPRTIRLHLHAQAEGIGTVAEGILSLSEDGWIVGANRVALQLVQMHTKAIGATQLSSVFDVGLSDVLSRHRRRPGQILRVQLRDGSTLFVQVQGDQALAAAHAVTPQTSVASADQNALDRLDTGDLKWRAAADKVRRVLDKPIPVLIQGASGVGKEYFARAIHDSSPRKDAPFVAINCAAIPESLIESELFGYAPGAFTGARKEGSLGRIREANGGTLFLDEIGDMPLLMQSRLLRVLQERCVTPLGGGRAMAVDFALVCASHCQLTEAMAQGRFRSDLYYRINGLAVLLPALRERNDFAALTARMLDEFNPGRDVSLAPQLLQKMQAYAWPGNLRQLASVLRTASAMRDDDESQIDFHHLADDIQEALVQTGAPLASRNAPAPANLRAMSEQAVAQALQSSRGNISLAARTLGISRQTLYRKLQQ